MGKIILYYQNLLAALESNTSTPSKTTTALAFSASRKNAATPRLALGLKETVCESSSVQLASYINMYVVIVYNFSDTQTTILKYIFHNNLFCTTYLQVG